MRPPTGSGRRVEAHRRRSCLARGFRGGVSPSLLVSGGYHFGVGFRSELGVARHLSILTLCALFLLSALQLASIAASRAEVATRQPLSSPRRDPIQGTPAGRVPACLLRAMTRGEAASQQRTMGRRPDAMRPRNQRFGRKP